MANGTEIRALELGEQIAQKQKPTTLIRYAIILTKRAELV